MAFKCAHCPWRLSYLQRNTPTEEATDQYSLLTWRKLTLIDNILCLLLLDLIRSMER